MSSFRNYCRGLTDVQLAYLIAREDAGRRRDPERETYYRDAREEAAARGWDMDCLDELDQKTPSYENLDS